MTNQIWDAAGVVRFKSVNDAFYRAAVGAMLVYDISRRSTFDELETLLENLRRHCHKSIGESLVAIGRKEDILSFKAEWHGMLGTKLLSLIKSDEGAQLPVVLCTFCSCRVNIWSCDEG